MYSKLFGSKNAFLHLFFKVMLKIEPALASAYIDVPIFEDFVRRKGLTVDGIRSCEIVNVH